MHVIGLMSGTSLDGVDAALIEIDGSTADLAWSLVAFRTIPYDARQREQIHAGITQGNAESLCRLHADLGEWFAAAAAELCHGCGVPLERVELIGSHGQTLWHEPPGARRGATLQLACPATIAERTGIPVVSDFRTRDVAAGGQGAPLVPWADRYLYSATHPRALLNIGGMANVTFVPARGSADALLAFDTGPGNALIDAAAQLASDGRETFDDSGRRARTGHIDEALLAALRAHPFFAQTPPKSTGREVFGRPFVEALVRERSPVTPEDWSSLIATFTALTAVTIADALHQWILPRGVAELVVTGGGARNECLLDMIAARVPVPVRPGEAVGIDADAKEAVAFAALAWAHVRGLPGNVPEATGAAGPRVLGSYTPGGAR